jgi:hypothetical protein
MRIAVYDLGCNSPSFDFITFSHYAWHKKAERIWFVKGFNGHKEYGDEESEKKRVQTIILPLCRLYGFQWEFHDKAPEGEEVVWPDRCSQREAHLMRYLKDFPSGPAPMNIPAEYLERAASRMGGKKLVVILRNAEYEDSRNTGQDWRRWGAEHDAFLLEDWYKEGMPLEERIAIYELASLNIGVNNGNMAVNYFSRRPYLSIKMLPPGGRSAGWIEGKHGLKVGDQMPWAAKNQRIVWNDSDHYDTITREYSSYVDAQ